MGSLNPSPDASPPHRDFDAERREWVRKYFPDAKVVTEGTDEEVRRFVDQHWQRLRQQQKAPGTDEKNVGKALMIFGILITIFSLFGSSSGGGIFGFILSIIGTALYAHGNRKQGNSTTVIGGGFVSFDGV